MTPTPLRRAARRLRALFDRRGLERELDDELRSHLEMEQEALVRQGLSPEAARARALRLRPATVSPRSRSPPRAVGTRSPTASPRPAAAKAATARRTADRLPGSA